MSDQENTYLDQIAVGGGLSTLWLQADGSYIISDEPPPDDEDREVIRQPHLKKLSNENKNLRLKNKDLTSQIEHLTQQIGSAGATQGGSKELRVEAAMLRAILASPERIRDAEAALRLADTSIVAVAEDGSVSGADEAISRVLERYPFLVDDHEEPPGKTVPGFNDQPSGRQTNNRMKGRSLGPDHKSLINKYPSLQNRR